MIVMAKKRGTLLRRVPLCLQGALRIAELPSVNVILPISLPTKLHLNGLLCRRAERILIVYVRYQFVEGLNFKSNLFDPR
ncbi:hypothetical protein WJH60_00075 [Burkholderia orbicola]|uniref:hypothetical protein n=1 Tax=Burkholderia orbicola TaxID=2978683 RepID=UPI0035C7213F